MIRIAAITLASDSEITIARFRHQYVTIVVLFVPARRLSINIKDLLWTELSPENCWGFRCLKKSQDFASDFLGGFFCLAICALFPHTRGLRNDNVISDYEHCNNLETSLPGHCIGISGIHANPDDFPLKKPTDIHHNIRVFRPFVRMTEKGGWV